MIKDKESTLSGQVLGEVGAQVSEAAHPFNLKVPDVQWLVRRPFLSHEVLSMLRVMFSSHQETRPAISHKQLKCNRNDLVFT